MGGGHCYKTNDAIVVTKFFKKTIFPRFGCPRALISNNETYFIEEKFKSPFRKYGVLHQYALPYHPQSSGQVEISNCKLRLILQKTVRKSRKNWSNKLDDTLRAYRTTFKTPIGTTPFRLVYRNHCHLPMALEHRA